MLAEAAARRLVPRGSQEASLPAQEDPRGPRQEEPGRVISQKGPNGPLDVFAFATSLEKSFNCFLQAFNGFKKPFKGL